MHMDARDAQVGAVIPPQEGQSLLFVDAEFGGHRRSAVKCKGGVQADTNAERFPPPGCQLLQQTQFVKAVGDDGGLVNRACQLHRGFARGGVVDLVGCQAVFRRQKHLTQAGGVCPETLSKHRLQHLGMGVALHRV